MTAFEEHNISQYITEDKMVEFTRSLNSTMWNFIIDEYD